MNIQLNGKNALVCGSSQGIGRAIAIELSRQGANVTLLARNAARLADVWAALDHSQGQHHSMLVADLSEPESVHRQVSAHSLTHNMPYHILINNSGGPSAGNITDADSEQFLAAFQIHLIANQRLAQTVLPGMKSEGYGRIINITSTSVKEPLAQLGVSNTTRWAVAGWAKTWANEVAQFGITVNTILPGYTETDRLESLITRQAAIQKIDTDQVRQQMLSVVPAKRFGKPEEIAALAAFLASPAAAYINGTAIPVDGGRTKSL